LRAEVLPCDATVRETTGSGLMEDLVRSRGAEKKKIGYGGDGADLGVAMVR
jgi:hypothetical protein